MVVITLELLVANMIIKKGHNQNENIPKRVNAKPSVAGVCISKV